MILSIGMIVKNEEKHLRSCLQALTPILKELDSELIIADTGSTDNTVAIAREFTKNVFHFEWCDDFSAARNATLEKASGEWFMFIDGDEVLQDAGELIFFFKSGEYKKYNSASYIQRNYMNEDMLTYSDFHASRMTKRTTETRFVGAVHEVLRPFLAPTRMLTNTIVDHYGYFFSDEKFRDQKCERNKALLLKELERNPESAIRHLQLMEVYMAQKDYDSALNQYFDGLKYARKHTSPALLYGFYANAVSVYYNTNRLNEALDVIRKYFDSRTKTTAFDIEMYAFEGFCHAGMNDYSRSVEAFENYVRIYKEFKSGMHHTNEMVVHSIQFVSPAAFRRIIYTAVNACIKINDYKKAFDFLDNIPFSHFTGAEKDLKLKIESEFKVMNQANDYTRILKLYEQADEKTRLPIQQIINELCTQNSDAKLQILKLFWQVRPTDTFIELLHIYYADMEGNPNTREKIRNIIPGIREWNTIYVNLIYYFVKYEIPIKLFETASDPFDLYGEIGNMAVRYNDTPEIALNYAKNHVAENAFEKLWIGMLCQGVLPFSLKMSKDQRMDLLRICSENLYGYLSLVCREEVLADENVGLLQKQLRFGYFVHNGLAALQRGDWKGYRRQLELAMSANKDMGPFIRKMLDESISDEMEECARAVKGAIYNFIRQGQMAYARQTLMAYEQINPNDEEIRQIKDKYFSNS